MANIFQNFLEEAKQVINTSKDVVAQKVSQAADSVGNFVENTVDNVQEFFEAPVLDSVQKAVTNTVDVVSNVRDDIGTLGDNAYKAFTASGSAGADTNNKFKTDLEELTPGSGFMENDFGGGFGLLNKTGHDDTKDFVSNSRSNLINPSLNSISEKFKAGDSSAYDDANELVRIVKEEMTNYGINYKPDLDFNDLYKLDRIYGSYQQAKEGKSTQKELKLTYFGESKFTDEDANKLSYDTGNRILENGREMIEQKYAAGEISQADFLQANNGVYLSNSISASQKFAARIVEQQRVFEQIKEAKDGSDPEYIEKLQRKLDSTKLAYERYGSLMLAYGWMGKEGEKKFVPEEYKKLYGTDFLTDIEATNNLGLFKGTRSETNRNFLEQLLAERNKALFTGSNVAGYNRIIGGASFFSNVIHTALDTIAGATSFQGTDLAKANLGEARSLYQLDPTANNINFLKTAGNTLQDVAPDIVELVLPGGQKNILKYGGKAGRLASFGKLGGSNKQIIDLLFRKHGKSPLLKGLVKDIPASNLSKATNSLNFTKGGVDEFSKALRLNVVQRKWTDSILSGLYGWIGFDAKIQNMTTAEYTSTDAMIGFMSEFFIGGIAVLKQMNRIHSDFGSAIRAELRSNSDFGKAIRDQIVIRSGDSSSQLGLKVSKNGTYYNQASELGASGANTSLAVVESLLPNEQKALAKSALKKLQKQEAAAKVSLDKELANEIITQDEYDEIMEMANNHYQDMYEGIDERIANPVQPGKIDGANNIELGTIVPGEEANLAKGMANPKDLNSVKKVKAHIVATNNLTDVEVDNIATMVSKVFEPMSGSIQKEDLHNQFMINIAHNISTNQVIKNRFDTIDFNDTEQATNFGLSVISQDTSQSIVFNKQQADYLLLRDGVTGDNLFGDLQKLYLDLPESAKDLKNKLRSESKKVLPSSMMKNNKNITDGINSPGDIGQVKSEKIKNKIMTIAEKADDVWKKGMKKKISEYMSNAQGIFSEQKNVADINRKKRDLDNAQNKFDTTPSEKNKVNLLQKKIDFGEDTSSLKNELKFEGIEILSVSKGDIYKATDNSIKIVGKSNPSPLTKSESNRLKDELRKINDIERKKAKALGEKFVEIEEITIIDSVESQGYLKSGKISHSTKADIIVVTYNKTDLNNISKNKGSKQGIRNTDAMKDYIKGVMKEAMIGNEAGYYKKSFSRTTEETKDFIGNAIDQFIDQTFGKKKKVNISAKAYNDFMYATFKVARFMDLSVHGFKSIKTDLKEINRMVGEIRKGKYEKIFDDAIADLYPGNSNVVDYLGMSEKEIFELIEGDLRKIDTKDHSLLNERINYWKGVLYENVPDSNVLLKANKNLYDEVDVFTFVKKFDKKIQLKYETIIDGLDQIKLHGFSQGFANIKEGSAFIGKTVNEVIEKSTKELFAEKYSDQLNINFDEASELFEDIVGGFIIPAVRKGATKNRNFGGDLSAFLSKKYKGKGYETVFTSEKQILQDIGLYDENAVKNKIKKYVDEQFSVLGKDYDNLDLSLGRPAFINNFVNKLENNEFLDSFIKISGGEFKDLADLIKNGIKDISFNSQDVYRTKFNKIQAIPPSSSNRKGLPQGPTTTTVESVNTPKFLKTSEATKEVIRSKMVEVISDYIETNDDFLFSLGTIKDGVDMLDKLVLQIVYGIPVATQGKKKVVTLSSYPNRKLFGKNVEKKNKAGKFVKEFTLNDNVLSKSSKDGAAFIKGSLKKLRELKKSSSGIRMKADQYIQNKSGFEYKTIKEFYADTGVDKIYKDSIILTDAGTIIKLKNLINQGVKTKVLKGDSLQEAKDILFNMHVPEQGFDGISIRGEYLVSYNKGMLEEITRTARDFAEHQGVKGLDAPLEQVTIDTGKGIELVKDAQKGVRRSFVNLLEKNYLGEQIENFKSIEDDLIDIHFLSENVLQNNMIGLLTLSRSEVLKIKGDIAERIRIEGADRVFQDIVEYRFGGYDTAKKADLSNTNPEEYVNDIMELMYNNGIGQGYLALSRFSDKYKIGGVADLSGKEIIDVRQADYKFKLGHYMYSNVGKFSKRAGIDDVIGIIKSGSYGKLGKSQQDKLSSLFAKRGGKDLFTQILRDYPDLNNLEEGLGDTFDELLRKRDFSLSEADLDRVSDVGSATKKSEDEVFEDGLVEETASGSNNKSPDLDNNLEEVIQKTPNDFMAYAILKNAINNFNSKAYVVTTPVLRQFDSGLYNKLINKSDRVIKGSEGATKSKKSGISLFDPDSELIYNYSYNFDSLAKGDKNKINFLGEYNDEGRFVQNSYDRGKKLLNDFKKRENQNFPNKTKKIARAIDALDETDIPSIKKKDDAVEKQKLDPTVVNSYIKMEILDGMMNQILQADDIMNIGQDNIKGWLDSTMNQLNTIASTLGLSSYKPKFRETVAMSDEIKNSSSWKNALYQNIRGYVSSEVDKMMFQLELKQKSLGANATSAKIKSTNLILNNGYTDVPKTKEIVLGNRVYRLPGVERITIQDLGLEIIDDYFNAKHLREELGIKGSLEVNGVDNIVAQKKGSINYLKQQFSEKEIPEMRTMIAVMLGGIRAEATRIAGLQADITIGNLPAKSYHEIGIDEMLKNIDFGGLNSDQIKQFNSEAKKAVYESFYHKGFQSEQKLFKSFKNDDMSVRDYIKHVKLITGTGLDSTKKGGLSLTDTERLGLNNLFTDLKGLRQDFIKQGFVQDDFSSYLTGRLQEIFNGKSNKLIVSPIWNRKSLEEAMTNLTKKLNIGDGKSVDIDRSKINRIHFDMLKKKRLTSNAGYIKKILANVNEQDIAKGDTTTLQSIDREIYLLRQESQIQSQAEDVHKQIKDQAGIPISLEEVKQVIKNATDSSSFRDDFGVVGLPSLVLTGKSKKLYYFPKGNGFPVISDASDFKSFSNDAVDSDVAKNAIEQFEDGLILNRSGRPVSTGTIAVKDEGLEISNPDEFLFQTQGGNSMDQVDILFAFYSVLPQKLKNKFSLEDIVRFGKEEIQSKVSGLSKSDLETIDAIKFTPDVDKYYEGGMLNKSKTQKIEDDINDLINSKTTEDGIVDVLEQDMLSVIDDIEIDGLRGTNMQQFTKQMKDFIVNKCKDE